MRITAGQYGGRVLKPPKNKAIRPTSDKVRQAIFNILLSYDLPAGARVLDGFCGSGALGLEALSRGADHCVFIDKSASSIALCKANIATLSLKNDNYQVIRSDLNNIRQRPPALRPVNLVFLDPPYGHDLINPALGRLSENGWLDPHALCVLETETKGEADTPAGFALCDDRTYGQTRIRLMRYEGVSA